MMIRRLLACLILTTAYPIITIFGWWDHHTH